MHTSLRVSMGLHTSLCVSTCFHTSLSCLHTSLRVCIQSHTQFTTCFSIYEFRRASGNDTLSLTNHIEVLKSTAGLLTSYASVARAHVLDNHNCSEQRSETVNA